MTLLALETSCDETSAAVVRQGRVLSNLVSSQTRLHAEYGGVVPELATREHLRNWLPVTRTALRLAQVEPRRRLADQIAGHQQSLLRDLDQDVAAGVGAAEVDEPHRHVAHVQGHAVAEGQRR